MHSLKLAETGRICSDTSLASQWSRINVSKIVGYESSIELIQRGYKTSEPGYKSSGYERSIGTKRLVTIKDNPTAVSSEDDKKSFSRQSVSNCLFPPCPVIVVFMHLVCVAIFCDSRS